MAIIETVAVPGEIAIGQLAKLRADYEAHGLYPVLLGSREDFERIEDAMEHGESENAILVEADAIDASAILLKKRELDPDLYSNDEGEWPDEEFDPMGIVTHLDVLTQKPLREVMIGLLKVKSPPEVFAQLRWGGWNDCPFAQEHVAIHRYWAAKYGAEVVSVTGDIVQCTVARPPQTRQESLALAREQYLYCSDIVDQGVETVSNLAATLMRAPVWYFWWD